MYRVSWALVALIACSSSSELVITVPAEALADGLTLVTVTASAKFRGAALANGSRVKFKTSAGTLKANAASTSTPVPELEATTTGGVAEVVLVPPTVAGDVTIIASYTNTNRESVTAQKVIQFKAAPPADAKTLGLSCTASCVSALISDIGTLTLPCSLTASTVAGAASPAVEVKFLAEAGVVTDLGPSADGSRKFSYVVPPSTPRPADVDWQGDEGDYQSSDGAGGTRNPRDMLVTILAAVKASESFTDLNGNNTYDEDEPFVDEAEPFLDVDDDGLFTSGIDRTLPEFDANANGVWDNGNGQYDAATWVGRSTHVVWTGDGTWHSDQTSLLLKSPGPPSSASLVLTFLDAFGNPPCGFNSSDQVSLTVGSAPSGFASTGTGQTALTTDLGFVFNPDGSYADLAKDGNSVPLRRRYGLGFSIQPTGSTGTTTAHVNATARYTPGPGSHSAKTVNLSQIDVIIQRD